MKRIINDTEIRQFMSNDVSYLDARLGVFIYHT